MPILTPMPTLADFAQGDLLAAAGITLIIMGLMSWIRKRRKREATTPRLTAQEELERNRQMRGVRGDLETLMVEIEQFAKRLSFHLDAKAVALELLLKQADDRIAQLKKLQAGQGEGMNDAARAGDATGPVDGQHANDGRDVSDGQHVNAGNASAVSAAQLTADVPSDPLSRSVYQLADQGLDANAIARKLEEHVGKIELILALRTA